MLHLVISAGLRKPLHLKTHLKKEAMKFKVFIYLLFTSLLVSCADTKNNKLIIGNWEGSEWIVNGSPSNQNPKETHFTFDDQGNYTFSYADFVEKGTYNVENEMLFKTDRPAGNNGSDCQTFERQPDL